MLSSIFVVSSVLVNEVFYKGIIGLNGVYWIGFVFFYFGMILFF